MKRRMRNRTYGVVGGDGLYPVTYPIVLKFQCEFDKLRPRRVPSHAFAVNLVRPGTEQPQRSECSAEDKARHFFFFD